jgi:hypothetical protein
MKTLNDGGPAFPTVERRTPPGCEPYDVPVNGMTLRDWFAGQALIGILQDKRYSEAGNEAACASELARYAGRIADEMLAERSNNRTAVAP